MIVADHLSQPTRRAARKCAVPRKGACPSYSVLLRVGFTVPLPLPVARCALTAPFHPYPVRPKADRAVCFLWHYP